ncbi:type IV secretory system conjugative DNA transfer VirD4/TraG family protein [Mucilaginibacter frigoritolerans]|uniref:Type IV secretory system conjugative DNA transfer VirD4/TraG family protein n=1 Tax=Mucilaginibacter frigoritolerans TaxID=652788 RepID=A0A562TUM8_9SPHI|nr:type IV secretory system conjugative DNA transfer family protein [Mucilaginibacter frigoritolerans]TWI96806.1 type IV secretory system conjugative DNA transfer VirD4/TraG family protein [Mucilaginibacter frigoritolerans]
MKTVNSIILFCMQGLAMLIVEFFQALVMLLNKPGGENASFSSTLSIASPFGKGLWIGKNRRLSRRQSMANAVIYGPSGSGKTSTLIFPNLFSLKKCSMLITDVSGELLRGASGYQSKHFKILPIHLSNPSIGNGYNPIINTEDPNDVHKIIDILVASTLDAGSKGDKFWSLSVKTILVLMAKLTLYQPEEHRNFANILHLIHCLSSPTLSKKVDELVAQTGDKKLITEYLSFIGNSEKTMQNILASAKAALVIFSDSHIAKATATTAKIDFNQLRTVPTAIYLLGTVGTADYTAVLTGMFFQQFYAHALSRIPTKKELPIHVILEECAAYYIKILPLALSNGRKHFLSTLACLQSVTQLKSRYGDEAENITANCAVKIFLPGNTSLDVLRDIEALSGTCTYVDEKGREKTKHLVTASEARLLPKNRSLIIALNVPIIKGYLSPYWRNLNFRRYASIPPISLTSTAVDTDIPFLI